MGLPVTYCPICGGPYELPAIYDEPADDISWVEDVELFALPSSLPRHDYRKYTTGEEEGPPEPPPTEQPDFFGPAWWVGEPGEFGYNGTTYGSFYGDDFGNVVFPMHKACAEIVRRVVDLKDKSRKECDPAISLRDFYNALLRRQEADMNNLGGNEYNGLWWEHNYYGAQEFWGYARWDDEGDDNEIFLANPLQIADPTAYVLSLLQPVSLQQPSDKARSRRSNHPLPSDDSRLAALPQELFDRVCDFLQSSSILDLCLSCKTYASRIELEQRFFLNLLTNGFDIPYLWDINISACFSVNKSAPRRSSHSKGIDDSIEQDQWNWRGLAQALTNLRGLVNKELPGVDLPSSLWNRMRIWLIVEEALKSEQR